LECGSLLPLCLIDAIFCLKKKNICPRASLARQSGGKPPHSKALVAARAADGYFGYVSEVT
jgi:hypothetical protein